MSGVSSMGGNSMGAGSMGGSQMMQNSPSSGSQSSNSTLKILSARGSAVVDARTNTLIIRETSLRLEEAKKLGTFLYVGIWDDEMTRYYKGNHYPIISL